MKIRKTKQRISHTSGAHNRAAHPIKPIEFKCIYPNHNAIKLIKLTSWPILTGFSSMPWQSIYPTTPGGPPA